MKLRASLVIEGCLPHSEHADKMSDHGVIDTDLGWVGISRSARGLCASTLPRQSPVDALMDLALSSADREMDADDLDAIAVVVRARLGGEATDAAVGLDLSRGTPFQQAVWRATLTIPWGQTRSYGWIAEEIGLPRGAHAVGQAVSRNPLPILIPCHRVIAADGSLGGFGRGREALPTKRSLLRREGIYFAGPTLEMIRMTV